MNGTPTWLDVLSWVALALGVATATGVALDIVRGRRQSMPIMNVVWPVTALYFGPLALPFYKRFGRGPYGRARSRWQSVFLSASHCGAGCTLGDILADSLIVALGIVLVPGAVGTSYILDFSAAYAFGILFQYLPIRSMGRHSPLSALWAAAKADTLSLIAFEIGLFGWMALVRLVWFPGLEADSALFWFMMQVGMIIGFATAYPANAWLIRAGIKHAM